MAVLHFDEWKIQVDVEKTKQYYDAFSVADEDAQGYWNYVAFCNDLLDEEKAFFESFGIEASCCNVMSIGLTEDKRYPTAGGYCFAGRFLEKPEEIVMTVDELAENDFVDDRPDPRVYIGRYHFTFMDPDSLFARIPEETPEGFLYMEFFLEDMPWLLNEKPEMTMFYPPKPWQLFQKLHLKFQQRKENHEYIEELKGSLIKLFQNKHIEYSEMSKSSPKKYMETWFVSIVPKGDTVLRRCIQKIRRDYDYVLLDGPPSLGMLSINALAAADSAIIPVQAHVLATEDMDNLIKTVGSIKRQINPALRIDGIVMTMLDARTKLSAKAVRDDYGNLLRVFQSEIPFAVRAAEAPEAGVSIYVYDPGGKVAAAYEALTKEVLEVGSKQQKKTKSRDVR